jgi:FecR-like protein
MLTVSCLHLGWERPLRLAAGNCLILACLFFPAAAAAAELVGTVTLLEGSASLLRGPVRYALSEGVRLEPGDILELGDKALSQIEFTDGTIVDLASQSRFLVLAYAARSSGAGELFLLRGWMKVATSRQPTRVIGRCSSPLVELSTADATAVVQVSGAEASVFMETGEARVAQVSSSGKVGDATRIRGSQFVNCKQEQRCTVVGRPSQAFLTALPRSFMDTLPSRMAKFKERNVALKRSGDFTYVEVQDWVNSVPAVRRAMVSHWHSKLGDPAFRSAIAAGLKDHPEWDRLINPEKYEHPPLSDKGGQPQVSETR